MSGMPIIGRAIPLLDVVRRDPRTPDIVDGGSDGDFNGNLHWIILRGRLRSHDVKRRKILQLAHWLNGLVTCDSANLLRLILSLEALQALTLYIISKPRGGAPSTPY